MCLKVLISSNPIISGCEEAVSAGKALKGLGYQFDVAHTSVLKRAQITLNSVLKEVGQTDIPINKTWRLNERHYGGLTGLNKAETAAKYGEAQVIALFIVCRNKANQVRTSRESSLSLKNKNAFIQIIL